jgi:hypothetical protein
MTAVRPRNETVGMVVGSGASILAVIAGTRAWVAGPLFGLLFILRFALQPPAGRAVSGRRRMALAFLGCSALACLVWALGVRVAHWPG